MFLGKRDVRSNKIARVVWAGWISCLCLNGTKQLTGGMSGNEMISEPKYYITTRYTTPGTNGLELFSDSRSQEGARNLNHDQKPEPVSQSYSNASRNLLFYKPDGK